MNREHYGADLAAFATRVKVFEITGRSDNKVGAHERRVADLIEIREQAEALLKKWGEPWFPQKQ